MREISWCRVSCFQVGLGAKGEFASEKGESRHKYREKPSRQKLTVHCVMCVCVRICVVI